MSSCFCFSLKWWHPTLTSCLLVSNETLIKAGSYHLFMQNTLTLWLLTTGQLQGRTAAKISPEERSLQAGESQFTMLGFLHFMLSYSALSPSFHSSPSVWLQQIMWHCLILCLQNALLFYLHPVLLCVCVFFLQISKCLLCTLSGISLLFYLSLHHSSSPHALSHLIQDFPLWTESVLCPDRSCLSSVLTVLSVGITMMDGDPLHACSVCKRTFWQSWRNINSVWFGVLCLLFFPFQSRRVTVNVVTNYHKIIKVSFSFVDETIPRLQG